MKQVVFPKHNVHEKDTYNDDDDERSYGRNV